MTQHNILHFLCDLLHWAGILHFHEHASPRLNRLHLTFVYFNYTLISAVVCFHAWSMLTRARHDRTEFVTNLFEFLMGQMALWECWALCMQRDRISRILGRMDSAFQPPSDDVLRRGTHKIRVMYGIFLPWVIGLISASIMQVLLPLSEEELAFQARIYPSQHPERMFLTPIRIPFVDPTISPAYEVMLCVQIYMGGLLLMFAMSLVVFIPIVIIHLEGQYIILSELIMKLGSSNCFNDEPSGQKKLETKGRTKYVYVQEQTYKKAGNMPSHGTRRKEDIERDMEHDQMRHIIRFHQNLIEFQRELISSFGPFIVPIGVVTTIGFTLVLYLLLVNPSDLSYLRIFRFVTQMNALVIQYFYLNNSSDMLDHCNALLRAAIRQCAWFRCAPAMRRDLLVLLRQAQRDNHLRVCYGMMEMSRVNFLRAVRQGYTYANFMLKAKK